MKRFIISAAIMAFVLGGCKDSGNGSSGNDEAPMDKSPTTCVKFVNNNDFTTTIYRTDSKVGEIARLAPGTTSAAIEAKEEPQGVIYYLSYHLIVNDIPFPYDDERIVARIDNGKTTSITIPLLYNYTAEEKAKTIPDKTYIKIKNNSDYSMLLVYKSKEEIPVGALSPIVMPDESVYYIVSPSLSDVSSYQFMKNTAVPIAIPEDISSFEGGHLYSFNYDGANLTLLADTALSIDNALEDALPTPSGITAQALSTSRISIAWSAVSKSSGYNLYRSSSEDGTYTKVNEATIIENDYTDTGLTAETSYYYKLVSVGVSERESQQSDAVYATTLIQTIGNISYSPITGSAWTLQSDGSYKVPDGYYSSKVRVNFTSYVSNATITIQLYVCNSYTSSYYNYAYIGYLDNSSASYINYYNRIAAYYYSDSTYSSSKTVTITVPSAGSHFVEIGYYDDRYGSSSTMYATFQIVD